MCVIVIIGIFVKYGAESVENAVDMPLNYLDLTHYLYGDTPFPLNDITEHEICIDVLSNLSVIWTEQVNYTIITIIIMIYTVT